MLQPRFLNLGDSALTLEFGDAIDRQLVSAVAAFDTRLTQEKEAGKLTGIIETVPTFRSLTVIFDPLLLSRATLQERLMVLLSEAEDSVPQSSRRWSLPVCYGGDYGPDLEAVALSRGWLRRKLSISMSTRPTLCI